MPEATAFVPAHISGFFQPCYLKTPERTGSRNGGLCLDLGVFTKVRVKPADRTKVKISIDGKRAPEAKTTMSAVRQLLSVASGSFEIEVDHYCQVPVGAGYGASGAGALGAVLALSKALKLRASLKKLVGMAHVAEVTCGTGLGDVGAQILGGLVTGLQPGAPPYGRWRRIPVSQDFRVICATLSPLFTKKFLHDSGFRRRASKLGGLALENVVKRPTIEGFMLASREFAEGLGLLDGKLRTLIQTAEEAGAVGASQIMIGRAIFAFVSTNKLEAVRHAFSEILEPSSIFVTNINRKGKFC
ncbi:MAG TPA: kinase [Hadesarchaea archaeon]|nr:kinase [Hadesarchaea archaeon]